MSQKLLFHQICDGDLTRDAQLEFESLQKKVDQFNQKGTMTIKITVFPNEPKKGLPDKFNELEYEVVPATFKKTSERYVAERGREGLIVGDGKTLSDILQEELVFDDLEDNKTITFKKQIGDNYVGK